MPYDMPYPMYSFVLDYLPTYLCAHHLCMDINFTQIVRGEYMRYAKR